MTPDEFKTEMEAIDRAKSNDAEERHRAMDDLMCRLLKELGYGDGVKVFEETYRWYA